MSGITDFISSLTARVESVGSCEDLQEQSAKLLAPLEDLIQSFTEQINSLATLVPLMAVPTDPASAQAWIGAFIATRIAPMQESAVKAQSQIPEVVAALAELTNAIQSKASEFNNCSIVG